MKWRRTCALALWLWAGAAAADEPTLVLNDVNGPPFTTAEADGFLDRVAQSIFISAGRQVRLVQMPAERGLLSTNAGIEDGDLTRIAGIEKKYPNLRPVPEKIIDWRFSAFSLDPHLHLAPGWAGLLPHSVGIIKGWKIAEAQLQGAKHLIIAENVAQLFRLLTNNRVDAVVYSREMGLWYLQEHHIKGVYLQDPPLETRAMFIYLNSRHAALIPRLAANLRALKADGRYARWYQESVIARQPAAP